MSKELIDTKKIAIMGVLLISGCGDDPVVKQDANTVTIKGTVAISAVTSSSILSKLTSGFSIFVAHPVITDDPAAAAGMSATCMGIDGTSIGTATVGDDGVYAIEVPLSKLKPKDVTGDTYTASFFMQATDAVGKKDVRAYCETEVVEGVTSAISCDGNSDTTLATFSLLDKSGCELGKDCSEHLKDLDPACYVELQTHTLKSANLSTGEGIADDQGVIKSLITGAMAGGVAPADVGFETMGDLVDAVLDGQLAADQLAIMASAATTATGIASVAFTDNYDKAIQTHSALEDLFYAGYAAAPPAAPAAIHGVADASVSSACEHVKKDPTYAQNLADTFLATQSLAELNTLAKVDKVQDAIAAVMAEYCTGAACTLSTYKPAMVMGYMAGCGGTLVSCGLVDASGAIQTAAFDDIKGACDSYSGTGNYDDYRNFGLAWEDTFSDKGFAFCTTPATCSTYSAYMQTEITKSTYDPSKTDWSDTAGVFTTNLTGYDQATLTACLGAADSPALKETCFPTQIFSAPVAPGSLPVTSCGDHICQGPAQNGAETDATCPQDCGATSQCIPLTTTCAIKLKDCGTIFDECGKQLECGQCTAPSICGGSGVPNLCSSISCGDMICNESPASCPMDCPSQFCGDRICQGPAQNGAETDATCPQDCAIPVCGDHFCTGYETIGMCPQDCTI